jgi:hypothetical protein
MIPATATESAGTICSGAASCGAGTKGGKLAFRASFLAAFTITAAAAAAAAATVGCGCGDCEGFTTRGGQQERRNIPSGAPPHGILG